MNKNELISAIAKKTGYTKSGVSEVVDAMIATIVDTVKSGEDVNIVKFGKFEVKERAARSVPNPQDRNAMIEVPASKAVHFKVSSVFKDEVKNA